MSSVVSPAAVVEPTLYVLAASVGLYGLFISLLTIPHVQNQVIYLNSVTLTLGQDVNIPEQWGFLHNQATPFYLKTPDHELLHAWHIAPLDLYGKLEQALVNESWGLVPDITQRLGFKLLRDDPNSLLVLYLHGAAGTLGSGYRPPSYRAIYSGAPDRIHVVAIDYRGLGTSTGSPSEKGLVTDATALVDWAMNEAGIPADRIVIWAQSIGTAVASSLVQQMAARRPAPVLFAGLVLVAPFADVKTLTATYQVAGTVPLLGPLARFPRLLDYLNTFIRDKWPSKDRLAEFVRICENLPGESRKYHITIIHAEDDYDTPWHSDRIVWHAVNASMPDGISFEDLEKEKEISKLNMGAGGWVVNRQATKGVIREEISKHGLHDRIMGYPVISLAVVRAFGIE